MKKKVIILGGGVAGMSAAHELMERDFDVAVYEFKTIPGGKARSIPVPNTGTEGRKDLPGEHGFRFFPGFYVHLPDTLKRIPYGKNKHGVFDNLTQATRTGLARFDQELVEMLANFPKSWTDIKDLLKEIFDNGFGLTVEEVEYLASKLFQMMSSCEERRIMDYQRISWMDYINAKQQSENFKKLFSAFTRVCVAANAQKANATTIGAVYAQLMLDIMLPGPGSDRVLNGPTNEVWIGPWLDYLRDGGVDYHLNAKVESIQCVNGVITSATVTENGQTYTVQGDYYISALPVEVMAQLVTPEMIDADPILGNMQKLGEAVDWMTGIQFYLKDDVPIIHGHVAYMDSPWALTSISQKQFWPDVDLSQYGDGSVRGILSVDISDWHTPGIVTGKKAMDCTKEEIKEEVWAQIKKSLNVDGQVLISDDNLVTYFLDPDIQFVNSHDSINLEPLLVNLVGTWDLRPNAYTNIPNLFLASDYVRTNTDLATMEGANEAARRAVNGILSASGSHATPCKIWAMYEPEVLAPWRLHDQARFTHGLPWDGRIL